MSETVKIGIIGIGNMGSAHAKSILAGNIQGMELAAANYPAQRHIVKSPYVS